MRISESGAGMPGNPNQNTSNNSHQNFNSKSHNGGTIPILGNQMKRPPPSIQSTSTESHSATSNAPSSSGISVLTADKRGYSRKMFENMDFSRPPPGMNVPPPNMPTNFSGPPPSDDFDAMEENFDNFEGGYEPTQEHQWLAPPSAYMGDRPANSDAPPGDAAFDDKRDPWQRNDGRRDSRDANYHDRKRRRSRSRSRER